MQAPPVWLSLLPLLPSLFLSPLSLPWLSYQNKLSRWINEWIHGRGHTPALCCPPTEHCAAQRGEESASAFSGKYFLWVLSAIRWCPPLYLPLQPLSLYMFFRACARVSLRPLRLFVEAGPTPRKSENTLVERSSLDRRQIRSTPPLLQPLTPFPRPPHPTPHIIRWGMNVYAH